MFDFPARFLGKLRRTVVSALPDLSVEGWRRPESCGRSARRGGDSDLESGQSDHLGFSSFFAGSYTLFRWFSRKTKKKTCFFSGGGQFGGFDPIEDLSCTCCAADRPIGPDPLAPSLYHMLQNTELAGQACVLFLPQALKHSPLGPFHSLAMAAPRDLLEAGRHVWLQISRLACPRFALNISVFCSPWQEIDLLAGSFHGLCTPGLQRIISARRAGC